MSKYYEEGFSSFYKNKGKYINPYNIGTREFNDFERGWVQAQKRAPNSAYSRN